MTKEVHPSLGPIIESGGLDAIATYQPTFRERITPDLPAGKVTILGDAAHAMVPVRGAGANTAALTAGDLAKLLIRAHGGGDDPASVVLEYLEKMVPRGTEAALSSRAAGEAWGDDPASIPSSSSGSE